MGSEHYLLDLLVCLCGSYLIFGYLQPPLSEGWVEECLTAAHNALREEQVCEASM